MICIRNKGLTFRSILLFIWPSGKDFSEHGETCLGCDFLTFFPSSSKSTFSSSQFHTLQFLLEEEEEEEEGGTKSAKIEFAIKVPTFTSSSPSSIQPLSCAGVRLWRYSLLLLPPFRCLNKRPSSFFDFLNVSLSLFSL